MLSEKMGKELRFGVLTIQNIPWKEKVKQWKYIEKLGFDSVWLADHFTDPVNPSGHWFEAWTLLSSLAVVTEKIRIGTLITPITLRHPAILARQAITVDHISNGRLELALGTGPRGNTDPVYGMIGITDWDPPERVRRFKEQVEIIDGLLREGQLSYDGKYYTLTDTQMNPRPIQKPRPPITIAAMGDSMLKIASQYADVWNSFGTNEWREPEDIIFEKTKNRIEKVNQFCEDIGRNPNSLRYSILFYSKHSLSIFQSEDNFMDIVHRYLELGITEFIFYIPFFDESQTPALKRVATEVIPDLRQ